MRDYANPRAVVDTEWLADHFVDTDVTVVDIHLDSSPYEAGHVPGAVAWNAVGTLVQPDYRTNFDPAHVESLLGSAGISNDSIVVMTSEHPGLAAWGYWYLKTIGHRDVRVLDGGQRKWVAEGRPLTTDVAEIDVAIYEAPPLDPSRRARLDDVVAGMDDDQCVLLDVRTAEEYRGELFMLAPPTDGERSGHIPGATPLYYEESLNDDGTFRSVEELRSLYEQTGVSLDKNVITYCAVGMRAGHTWFVLSELLGHPQVTNYDRSWNEWGRQADTPIEQEPPEAST